MDNITLQTSSFSLPSARSPTLPEFKGLSDFHLEELSTRLAHIKGSAVALVSRELHAFCHLCDPSAGERLLALKDEELAGLDGVCQKALLQFFTRANPNFTVADSVAPSVPQSALTKRSKIAVRQARARDGDACLMTGIPDSAVCHIIPFSLGRTPTHASPNSKTSESWMVIELFFNPSTLSFLEKELLNGKNGKTRINRGANLVTLTQTLRTFWEKGRLGFIPISYPATEKASTTNDFLPVKTRLIPKHEDATSEKKYVAFAEDIRQLTTESDTAVKKIIASSIIKFSKILEFGSDEDDPDFTVLQALLTVNLGFSLVGRMAAFDPPDPDEDSSSYGSAVTSTCSSWHAFPPSPDDFVDSSAADQQIRASLPAIVAANTSGNKKAGFKFRLLRPLRVAKRLVQWVCSGGSSESLREDKQVV
ncbi:MAG: hypothetical protein M1829_005225 [Trizodia sp. TS-e1964]|nr:MAG: hypothetical protein M1829_005225 [Trizodia sp. TS-e1964]